MKISLLSNFKINSTTNTMSKPMNKKISFQQQPDEFRRLSLSQEQQEIDYEYIDDTLKLLDEKLDKLLKEGDDLKNRKFDNVLSEIYALNYHNTELQQLRIEYKKIREMLNLCKENNISKNAKILASFLQKIEQIGENKGFNRIVGYDEIKNELKNKFILDTILKDKISDKKVKVPNAMLFYGPTGNGKTTFAIALAEQALMAPFVVNASQMTEQESMNLVEEFAKQSKNIYENSNDKKRSIIIVDEVDTMTYENSPVLERLKKIINNCADEYKCTLFLTTNHPLDLPEEILSKNITPFKIPIAPPNKTTSKAIIDKMLKQANCYQGIDTQKIVDEMFKNPSRKYSNGDINEFVKKILSINPNQTTNDFLTLINDANIAPSITSKKIVKFKKELEELNEI